LEKQVDRYVFAVYPEKGENFWDVNKELEYLSPYAQFKKKEGKRRSGRIMEAIWLCFDPKATAQQSGERSEEEIMSDIAENFLNDKKFPWAEYRTIITAYKKDCRSKIEKEMYYWEMELETRRVYQRSLPWETQREEKDKMLTTQDVLFKKYLDVLKEVDKERSEKKYHAGTQKSLLERQ
jgi:hypothetical protein